MRVLGIDPGLTRCGLGVVDRDKSGRLTMIDCGVIRSDSDTPIHQRLLILQQELESWIQKYSPDVIAVERVFSQHNVRTAMATGQAAGVALLLAAQSSLPIGIHTPSEVKAAVSGSGRADKKQVATMVMKILSLKVRPTPVDTTDALALAICHHWRGAQIHGIESARKSEKIRIAQLKRAR